MLLRAICLAHHLTVTRHDTQCITVDFRFAFALPLRVRSLSNTSLKWNPIYGKDSFLGGFTLSADSYGYEVIIGIDW